MRLVVCSMRYVVCRMKESSYTVCYAIFSLFDADLTQRFDNHSYGIPFNMQEEVKKEKALLVGP